MRWTPGRLNALPSLLDIGYFSAGELSVSWADQLNCNAVPTYPMMCTVPILCSQKHGGTGGCGQPRMFSNSQTLALTGASDEWRHVLLRLLPV